MLRALVPSHGVFPYGVKSYWRETASAFERGEEGGLRFEGWGPEESRSTTYPVNQVGGNRRGRLPKVAQWTALLAGRRVPSIPFILSKNFSLITRLDRVLKSEKIFLCGYNSA